MDIASTSVTTNRRPSQARRATVFVGQPGVVYLMFASYPLWWALGLGYFVWPLMTLPMAIGLLMRRSAVTPRWFGVWLLFLACMTVSLVELDSAFRGIFFSYRASIYVSATVLCLYVYNAHWRSVCRQIVDLLGLIWFVLIIGGVVGAALPYFSFSTPAQHLFPSSYLSNQWLWYMVHPGFAEVMDFLGYPVGRPKVFFNYTNQWGGCVGVLTPCAVVWIRERIWSRSRIVAVGIGLVAVIPIVISLDRGLWIGLAAASAYAGIRLVSSGRAQRVVAVGAGFVVLGTIVVLSPLGGLIHDRLTSNNNSNSTRSAVYAESVSGMVQSPLLGHGSPSASETDPNLPRIGTQSQYFLVAYSHGLPALVFFIGWFGTVWWRSRRYRSAEAFALHIAVGVGLVEMAYYDFMPITLHIMMLATAALALEFSRIKSDGQMSGWRGVGDPGLGHGARTLTVPVTQDADTVDGSGSD